MSRAGNITTAILMWCAIAAYVVVAGGHARDRRGAITVRSLRIAIVDTPPRDSTLIATRLVTPEKITARLSEAGIDPTGRPIDSVDTRAIEQLLSAMPEVKHVGAWSDLDGNLTIRIEPRTPAMRVITRSGYRFRLSDDGVIMPDRGDVAAYVPIVTGDIVFPFSPSASGSYAEMRRADYNDFLERFRALDAERRELTARAAATRAEIRAIRASGPKRWWSGARKRTFVEGKAARIAALESSRAETAAALSSLARLEADLKEKEKKSYQSYLFLSKLANFVEFIGRDNFWAAQVVQIEAVSGGNNKPASGIGGTTGGDWREPQLELIPRVGNHTILLGELDGTERRRMENLRLFYLKGLSHEGWNAYRHINIKYNNQIVCTK